MLLGLTLNPGWALACSQTQSLPSPAAPLSIPSWALPLHRVSVGATGWGGPRAGIPGGLLGALHP